LALAFVRMAAGQNEGDYCVLHPESAPYRVYMHLDAVDGIVRDVLENSGSSDGAPAAGHLLGHIEPAEPAIIWIERYQRLGAMQFEAGAQPADESQYVATYLASQEPAPNDLFPPAEDAGVFTLAINAAEGAPLTACLYLPASDGSWRAGSTIFPFAGRVVGPLATQAEDKAAEATGGEPAASEAVRDNVKVAAVETEEPPANPLHSRHRRLVPDYAPGSESDAAPSAFVHSLPEPYRQRDDTAPARSLLSRPWLWIAAAALAGAGLWFVPQFQKAISQPLETGTAEAAPRPLGLYVDSSGPSWRVLWNRAATASGGARDVKLFIRDSGEQNEADLAPGDLETGMHEYKPHGNDILFRLEVTDRQGRLSAESFRLLRTPALTPIEAVSAARPSLPVKSIPPRPIHKVAPVVPAGIRPRIPSRLPMDVRVDVDAKGRVVSAAPVSRHRTGLENYLAQCAVKAALLWRFYPATAEGKPVPGSEIIHFEFSR